MFISEVSMDSEQPVNESQPTPSQDVPQVEKEMEKDSVSKE